ncbi:MAG: hypothetical protein AB8B80_08990 [Marinicellaceae bacterium]
MNLNKISKILILTAFVSQASIVYSQELKLKYTGGTVTLPLDQNRNMTIDPDSGDIDIATSRTAEQIGNSLALSCTGDAPFVNLTKVINGTESALISYSLDNDPVYCEKSGQWSGLIPGNPLVTNSSETVTRNGNYTLTCHNAFGSTFDTEVVSNIAGPPTVSIDTTPEEVNSGGSVTVSWNINNSPTQCIKSGDWPTNGPLAAGQITNGPHSVFIQNVTSNQTYSLECTNGAGSSGLQSATVNIAGGATWPSCSGASAAILGGNEDRTILAQGLSAPTEYNGLFSDIYNNSGTGVPQPWPGSIGSSINLNIEKNKYVAAQFTTSNQSVDAQFLSQLPSNNEGIPPSGYTVSISECPGDFNVHLNQPACLKSAATFRWTTTPNPPGPAGFFCELDQNKTYYLNIVHSTNAQNDNYGTSSCLAQTANSCGHLAAQNLVQVR